MGKVAKSLFGGSTSKSTSSSSNLAFPFMQQAFSPLIDQGNRASGLIGNLLGLNGEPAQTQGFDTFRNSTGYNFGLNEGRRALTGSSAAKGLLNSGSTARALTQFGQDYGSTKFGDYLSQLQSMINPGLQAGGLISGAGQVSNSSQNANQNNKGFGGILGSVLTK